MTCTCPTVWHGVIPLPCPVHNPPYGSNVTRMVDRIRQDRGLLDRIAAAKPCPARVDGVLGFPEPTSIPCGLLDGHDGPHTYTISWTTS